MEERYDENNRDDSVKKEKAAVLGKWLWLLFWLIIPSAIAGILSNENIFGKESPVYLVGMILSAAVGILYGVILLQMKNIEDKYQMAGVFSILAAVLAMALEVLPVENPVLVLLIGLPALVLGLVAKYYEFYGHGAVLRDFDSIFSQKWLTLWKWYCIVIVGLIVSTLVVFVSFLLAALLLIVFAIGTMVIAIVQLVYLYKMAKLFREYAE